MVRIIKKISYIIFSLIISMNCFSQNVDNKIDVHFFGIIIPPTLENQKNISENLLSAHLRIIPEITFIDNTKPGIEKQISNLPENTPAIEYLDKIDRSFLIPNKQAIGIFAIINKIDEENLECTIYTQNFLNGQNFSLTENFKSFYKLLTDVKSSITNLISKTANIQLTAIQAPKRQMPKINELAMTVEGVSGTWSGEKEINKIILMRSGRGFVIFSNGASMPINVSIEINERNHKILKITQQGNFNASFYPDIPRQKALEYSQKASPIQWNFILTETGSLEGFKYTLVLDSDGKVAEQKKHVSWNKIN